MERSGRVAGGRVAVLCRRGVACGCAEIESYLAVSSGVPSVSGWLAQGDDERWARRSRRVAVEWEIRNEIALDS